MSLFYLSLCLLFILPTWSLLPPDDSSCNNQCFHQPPEACPPADRLCRCRHLPNCQKAAICCNVNYFTLSEGLGCGNLTSGIQSLHIRNATFESFNISLFQKVWRNLQYVTITDGNISRIDGEFAKNSGFSCLNLSSNHINSIEDRALGLLFNLSILDLSHNNLTEVPSVRKESVTLDISNNANLICSKLTNTFVSRPEIVFHNENQTFCVTTKDFTWFRSSETLPFSQVKAIHELQKNCYKNCTCEYRYVFIDKLPSYAVFMNCSGKKFDTLPVPLPDKTMVLDVSNNNITSLKELSDPSYENLRHLYAEKDQISSIQPLEGTKFISDFESLNLRYNNIKILETYVLDNIQFERNYNPRKINLGHNKLQCDCNTIKLKIWLLSKLSHIPDHDDIHCENLNVKVIELNSAKICQSPPDWTDYIYYVIGIEVLLLVGLVAKVSYDYWVFKSSGYLPWPANKMPRLPCDWVCLN